MSAPSTSALLIGDYVRVGQGPDTSSSSTKELVRAALRRRPRGTKLSAVKTKLISSIFSANSALSTALTASTPIALSSTNFPEMVDWVNVYDEIRVLSGVLYYTLWGDGTVGAAVPATGGFGVCFDAVSTGPTTLSAVRSNTYSTSPMFIASAAPIQDGPAQSFHKLNFKMPSPMVVTGSLSSCGSAWF